MDELRALVHRQNLSGDSKRSAVESAGLCACCHGSGLRPTTGLWVASSPHGISVGMQLTSPRVWSPWIKRLLLASVVSACGTVGWFTWIADLLGGL